MPIDQKERNFLGYFLPNKPIIIAIIAIFAALTSALTFIVPITIPATQGYINLGDIGVMISGILFGPLIGGMAGGIGSALTDIILAPIYAIPTLIIKGLEGFIVGFIADPRKYYKKINFRDILAVILGGSLMAYGYFLTEIYLYGFPSALFELFLNVTIQFGLAAVVALLFTKFARKNIIINLPYVFDKIFISEVLSEDA
ncbi:MAG: ECF transporter S component [Promethearchaeota archaeon]